MPLPKFQKLVQKAASAVDREIFPMPQWGCFFCRDSGLGCCPEISQVIEGYAAATDTPIVCQRRSCGKGGELFGGAPEFRELDWRFTPEVCEELHRLSVADWESTRAAWYEAKKNGRNLIVENAIEIKQQIQKISGVTNRNANDEREIQQRKEEAQLALDSDAEILGRVHLNFLSKSTKS